MHGRDIGGRHRYVIIGIFIDAVDQGKEDVPAHVLDPNLGRITVEIKVPVLINLSIYFNNEIFYHDNIIHSNEFKYQYSENTKY